MSTRSLLRIFDGPDIVAAVYRQCDGYPSGRGADLAGFLAGLELVNGISLAARSKKIANGPGCLAAQLVAFEKDGPGNVYLYPPRTQPAQCSAEYLYEIHVSQDEPDGFSVLVSVDSVSFHGRRKRLYRGNVSGFAKFCEEN